MRDGDRILLFNAESRLTMDVSTDLADAIRDREWHELPQDIIDLLVKNKVLVPKGNRYNYYDRSRIAFTARNYNPTNLSLVIAPTTGCNFDCPYCFEPKKHPKTVTPEVIEELEKFVRAHTHAKTLSITWYGGEPLLAFTQIKNLYEMLTKEDMPRIQDQTIVTNGYLFNEEVCEFFRDKNLKSIQITLDGTEEKHNTTRCLKADKSPTFRRIWDNIHTIRRMLPDTDIAIRVNIERGNWQDIIHIHHMIIEYFPNDPHISAYPGLIRKETSDGMSLNSDCIMTQETHDLYLKLKEGGLDISLFPKRAFHRGCMIHAANSYIIGPEGELYKCWNDVSDRERAVGSIFNDQSGNERLLLDYMTISVPYDDKCRECSVFPLCDGGCSLYRYRNVKLGCNYNLCSAYLNPETLKDAVIKGIITTGTPNR